MIPRYFWGLTSLNGHWIAFVNPPAKDTPYNIEQIGEEGLRISLAVAGFTMDDLDVEIEHNQLTIRGHQQDDDERIFLHRGIAARQFQRSFILADGIEILGAALDNGLLHIDMKRVIPESTARKIRISAPKATTQTNKQITQKAIEITDDEPMA